MTITFLRSEKFRQQQFAATAQPQAGKIEYDIDLTPGLAKKLMTYLDVFTYRIDISANKADLSSWVMNGFPSVESADPIECLTQVFNQADMVKKEKEVEEKEKEEAYQREVAENRKKILGNKEEALKVNFYRNNLDKMKVDQETHDFIESVRKEKEEAEYAAKVQAKENLKTWALANGSDLVKARIEENMNWLQLANDEYFESIKPEGFDDLPSYDEKWEIKNATLEQLAALREVRKDFPNAELVRYKYITKGNYEYGESNNIEHVDVIRVKVTSLDGSTKLFEKVLSREEVEAED